MEVLSQNGSNHIGKTENLKNNVFHKNGTNTNKSFHTNHGQRHCQCEVKRKLRSQQCIANHHLSLLSISVVPRPCQVQGLMVAMVSHVESRSLKSFTNFWPFWWPLCRLGSSSKAYWFACPQKMPFLSISVLKLARKWQNTCPSASAYPPCTSEPAWNQAGLWLKSLVTSRHPRLLSNRLSGPRIFCSNYDVAPSKQWDYRETPTTGKHAAWHNLFCWSSTSFVVQFLA